MNPDRAGALLLDTALAWHAAGTCILPAAGNQPRANSPKQPWPGTPNWKPYQTTRPTETQLRDWLTRGTYTGIGAVCGAISGNLEMLELEGRAVEEGAWEALADITEASGLDDLWATVTTGYTERTPSGGIHIIYRVHGSPVPPNTALARRPAHPDEYTDDDRATLAHNPGATILRVLIETRGEGGYVVIAPSNGPTHPTGRPWTLLAGGPDTVPTITTGQREALHAICAMFDQMPPPPPPRPPAPRPPRRADDATVKPGDDYNQRATWDQILEPHGWTCVGGHGHYRVWRRPGKDHGISATTGRNDADQMYVFTTSTSLPIGVAIDKFGAHAHLEHGGNITAAARALAAAGYGTNAAHRRPTHPPTSNGGAPPDPPDPDPPDPDDAWEAADRLRREIAAEAHKIRVRQAAHRLVLLESSTAYPEPALQQLTGFLSVEDPAATYRVDRLWPLGGRVLLASAYKAGKSTARDNLIRSLADGDPFLGEFTVAQPDGAIVVIDNELDERMLRRWLRQQGIQNTDRVHVLSLRGRVATFNITDPDTRARWAARLTGIGAAVVILDCLRPLLDAFAIKEATEAGQFLVQFDAMLAEASADEGIVVHHMGHTGERSRGDSRLRDWPDVEWKLVRQVDEETGESDSDAPRYFSAYGRDVDVPEGLLTYDPACRSLIYAGGNRREHSLDDAIPVLVDYVKNNEGMTQNGIVAAFRENGLLSRDKVRAGLRQAVDTGRLDITWGPRNAHRYHLPATGGTP